MRSTRILSIFWHSVESSCRSPDSANPSAHIFREHIKFLLKNYTPISIFEFLEIREQKGLIHSYTKPPLLLGFDDGFKNVIRYALPILEEYKTPAVFFVIGEILRNPDFVPWYVEVIHLIRKAVRKTILLDDASINLAVPDDVSKLRSVFGASFRTCKSEADRQTLLTNFAKMLGSARAQGRDLDEDLQFVNGKDLADLTTSSLLTLGSHAMRHYDLATLSHEEQVYELEQSDSLLHQRCQRYFPVIAYPNGSFNADTITIANGIYKAGFAVLLGASYRNLYAYPRIGLEHTSVEEVAYVISPKRRNYILPLKRVLHIAGVRRL